jgi:osmotically-inducible protein OsmY
MKLKAATSIAILLALLVAALPAQKQISDDQIYDNVRRKLASDPVVKGGALQVDVKAGVVTLRGAVESDKQKQKAEKLAKKVHGVKSVSNELTVVRRQPR